MIPKAHTSKISIVTINFNNLKGLIKTIRSIVNQSFNDIEYIVVDGGSTDGSAEYIEQNEAYFSYWVSEKDKGIYHAMNKGIKNASGEYILFLNSGDKLYNTEVLNAVFKSNRDAHILYGGYKFKDNLVDSKTQLKFSDFWHTSICHQSVLFKLRLFKEYGYYDESMKIAADWKFLVLALFLYRVKYEKLDVIISELEPEGLSSYNDNYNKITTPERNKIYNEYFYGFKSDYEELFYLRKMTRSRIVKIGIKLSRIFERIRKMKIFS